MEYNWLSPSMSIGHSNYSFHLKKIRTHTRHYKSIMGTIPYAKYFRGGIHREGLRVRQPPIKDGRGYIVKELICLFSNKIFK